MNTSLWVSPSTQSSYLSQTRSLFARQNEETSKSAADILEIGGNSDVSTKDAMNIVVERSMERIRALVDDARAQLGIPEDAVLDTSPEATAGRIADFALGFYGKWREKHTELAEEDARNQFAGFIGAAIDQGFAEARGILSALNVLNPDVETGIAKTYSIIQQRMQDFVKNGL
ncbi:MAG TPA: DUF5610 domain-containing protein [Candidatus Hydrogenedentes bacterium]|nr:DUF5610 domain-containing protein [Candidatus Hydrogenedentota bacterium]HPG66618.1 DUF5610 domain-containing protein [Candidatus Hydrogenedentota bacterium]